MRKRDFIQQQGIIMFELRAIAITGTLALLLFAACSSEAQRQEAEIIRAMEESFALTPATAVSPSQHDASWSEAATTLPPRTEGVTRPAAQTQAITPAATVMQDTAAIQIDPALQITAREVVHAVNTQQYATAVRYLARLMINPSLTPDQLAAVHDSMAQIQARIAMDPNLTEEEAQKIREAVQQGWR